MSDVRFALRQLARAPGFALVAVLSLALGIGATTTVLTWMRHLVLRPFAGVAHQEELVMVVSNQGGGNVSIPDLEDFVALGGVFSDAMVFMPTPASLMVNHSPEWVNAQIVSANAFDLLGVKPILGRAFLPTEDLNPGGDPVLIISERLWRRRFGGDPAVIGRVVELNRHPFTIIGVAPASFLGTVGVSIVDAWAPRSMIWQVRNQSTDFLTKRPWRGWLNLARLQPGVSVAQAHAAIETVNRRMAADHPDSNRDTVHRVVSLADCPWSEAAVVGPVLRLLLAVCAAVLLIVAANIASLLLVRAIDRRKEIGIRLAAGATRSQILRQLLMENVLLALLGGAAGVLLASWLVDTLPFLLPEPSSNLALHFSLDASILGLTLLLTLSTGLIFGFLPAWQASRVGLNEVLKEAGRSSAGSRSNQRARQVLVVAEVALALVLIVGAGLVLKGLERARQVEFGFEPDGVLLADLRIGMNGYTPDTGAPFYRLLRERLAGLPGVEEAALASWIPLGLRGCKGTDAEVDGYVRPAYEDATYPFATVSPRYFAAMRIPLVAGRDFTDQDDATAPAVAIVNETFARRFWPGQDPIGRTFHSSGTDRTVVGVAQSGKYDRLNESPVCFFYMPYQQGVPDLDLGICVRAVADPTGLTAAVRQTVASLDPGVDLLEIKPLTTHIEAAFLAQRMASLLLTLLGAVALALAAMGVYAVMAYSVSQRTREFGVRMALGASAGAVMALVLRQSLMLAAGGIIAGLALAAALSRLLTNFLYGVSPMDPATFVGVPLLLTSIVLLACWLPAWRATHVNPVEALRAE
jgi:predicted permease